MPTYEFRCSNGHEFEHFYRKISDAASELPCPECGVVATRQLSAGAGLLFKGSGFYLTDYGKNAHRKAGPAGGKSGDAKGGEKAEGAGAGGGDKSGDSKPAESKPAAEKPTTPKSSGSSGDDKS
jgi:putative FmdB family regulatory protein